MVTLQHAPPLKLYAVKEPETGGFSVKNSVRYKGVKWKFFLLNPGEAPILASQFDVEMAAALPHRPWTSIHKLCELLDEEGNTVSPSLVVKGHSHCAINVFVHSPEVKGLAKRVFGDRTTTFLLAVWAFQHRQLLGRDISGWLNLVSRPFKMPDEFGKEIHI